MPFLSPVDRARANSLQSLVPQFILKPFSTEPAITALVSYLLKKASPALRSAVNIRLKNGVLPVDVIANAKTGEVLLSFVDGKEATQTFYYDGRDILPASLTTEDVQVSYNKAIEDMNDYGHPGHDTSSNPSITDYLADQQKIVTQKISELNALPTSEPTSRTTVGIAISKI